MHVSCNTRGLNISTRASITKFTVFTSCHINPIKKCAKIQKPFKISLNISQMLQCTPTTGLVVTFHFLSFEINTEKHIHCKYDKSDIYTTLL